MSGLLLFTLFHTALSLIALVAGFVVVAGMLQGRRTDGWTLVFFVTAIATSVTGFMFPFESFLPSHLFGVISLAVLIPAALGHYVYGRVGAWRWITVLGIVVGLYLDAFVTVVQAFLKVPPLHALAPTGSEAPFAIAQLLLLIAFVWIGYAALRRSRGTLAVA